MVVVITRALYESSAQPASWPTRVDVRPHGSVYIWLPPDCDQTSHMTVTDRSHDRMQPVACRRLTWPFCGADLFHLPAFRPNPPPHTDQWIQSGCMLLCTVITGNIRVAWLDISWRDSNQARYQWTIFTFPPHWRITDLDPLSNIERSEPCFTCQRT